MSRSSKSSIEGGLTNCGLNYNTVKPKDLQRYFTSIVNHKRKCVGFWFYRTGSTVITYRYSDIVAPDFKTRFINDIPNYWSTKPKYVAAIKSLDLTPLSEEGKNKLKLKKLLEIRAGYVCKMKALDSKIKSLKKLSEKHG